jgi:hypothetical protein
MSGLNWDRLQREAERAYEDEARRRRKLGEQATADAEELADKVKRAGRRAADALQFTGDQSVYIMKGTVLLAHLPPSSMWNVVTTPEGSELQTLLLSPSRGEYVQGPCYKAGEWSWCGRGMPHGA